MVKRLIMKTAAICAAIGILALSMTAVPGIHAYLTEAPEALENNFTIALDPTTTVVEKYPSDVPDIDNTSLARFMKAVQIGNTGYIDCYVRVKLNFSDAEIRDETSLSWDGTNFWPYKDYKDHLPDGWIYNPDDDWFYYTPILYAGDWAELSKDLIYDKEIGEYFYDAEDSSDEMLVSNMITTPLIKYVKTQFKDGHDMRTFTISVVNESVPFYLGTDYKQAWDVYLSETWDLHPENGGSQE